MVARILVPVVFVGVIIGIFIYGYSFLETISYTSLTQNYIEFESLVRRPDFYNGKHICTVGKYIQADKGNVLIAYKGTTNSETIWVTVPAEKNLLGNIKQQLNVFLRKPTVSFESTAKVCGTFEYQQDSQSGFGYSEGFRYQII